jgi:hypothetical protein
MAVRSYSLTPSKGGVNCIAGNTTGLTENNPGGQGPRGEEPALRVPLQQPIKKGS